METLVCLDSDSFLLAVHRFESRGGCPSELIQTGTNFIGGERELQEAFTQLCPRLQEQLAKSQVRFVHNPPHAPLFGGTWEREERAIKTGAACSEELGRKEEGDP